MHYFNILKINVEAIHGASVASHGSNILSVFLVLADTCIICQWEVGGGGRKRFEGWDGVDFGNLCINSIDDKFNINTVFVRSFNYNVVMMVCTT